MYDYIKDAVASGKVMLEWDYSKGQPTVPLVKGMLTFFRNTLSVTINMIYRGDLK